MHIEQTGLEEQQRHGTGDHQSDGAGHHEPADGLGGDAAQGGGLADLADGHDHGAEDHGHDDQLQRADEQLTADVEEADGALGALGGDVLEEDVVGQGPDLAVRSEELTDCHEQQTHEDAGDHGDQHPDRQLVAVVDFLHCMIPFYLLFQTYILYRFFSDFASPDLQNCIFL